MVVGHSRARGLAENAAHEVVVVPDTTFEPGPAAGRFDAAYDSPRGEHVGGLVRRLEGYMAHAIAHAGGKRLDAEAVTLPDGDGQRDAGGRHPQACTAQLPGGSPVMSLVSCRTGVSCPLAIAGTDPTMDRVQVKKLAEPISNRNPDIYQ